MRYLITNILICQLNMNICSYHFFLQGGKRQKSDKSKLTSEEYSFFCDSFVCANGNTIGYYKPILIENFRKLIGFYYIKKLIKQII